MRDFFKEVWDIYESEMSKRDNADYDVNREQMNKLISAYKFFAETAEKCHGTIEPFRIVPAEVNGGVTMYCTVFYLHGEEIRQFSEVIRHASAVSIDSMDDGTVCISFTIPQVFQKKSE